MFKSIILILTLGIGLSQANFCSQHLLKAKNLQKQGLFGVFIPQCETDGTYKPKQCWASTGQCSCVDKNGTRIANFTRTSLSCKCLLAKYLVEKKKLIGAYAPQCRPDGSYEPMQCYGSTGQCWCVDELGSRLSNSTTVLQSCKCMVEQGKANGLLGAFRPRCETDGTYTALQYGEGYGWCVNPDGARINNKTRGLKACKCPLQNYVANKEGLLGAFRPNCDADGTFAALQCHENNCWCSRPDGSSMNINSKRLDVCTCYRQQEQIMNLGLAVSLPDCSK